MNHTDTPVEANANRDPLTGAVGSHPVGTGVGAALGATAAGAVAGSVVGPIGTLVGGAVGAILGGFAGKGVAEMIDPTAEDIYWRENHKDRPYAASGSSYDEYGPAYRFGVASFGRHPGRSFDEAETDLSRDWAGSREASNLDWDRARHASRDAWNRLSDRVERATPGDSDRDGK